MKYVEFFFDHFFIFSNFFFRNFLQSLEIKSKHSVISQPLQLWYHAILHTSLADTMTRVGGRCICTCTMSVLFVELFFPQTSLLNTTKSPPSTFPVTNPHGRWWSGEKSPVFHLGYENFSMPGGRFSANYKTWARLVSSFLERKSLFLFARNGVFSSTLTIKHCGLSWQTRELIAPIHEH